MKIAHWTKSQLQQKVNSKDVFLFCTSFTCRCRPLINKCVNLGKQVFKSYRSKGHSNWMEFLSEINLLPTYFVLKLIFLFCLRVVSAFRRGATTDLMVQKFISYGSSLHFLLLQTLSLDSASEGNDLQLLKTFWSKNWKVSDINS